MFAAVAAGLYADVGEAQEKMGGGFVRTYKPERKNAAVYEKLYERYRAVGSTLEDHLRK
jgi:L-ribulokinase